MADPLTDEEVARAVLADANAADAAAQAALRDAYQQWRKSNEEMRDALATPPAPG